MRNIYLLSIFILFQTAIFGQVLNANNSQDTADSKDSIDFIKTKKICGIEEYNYNDSNAKFFFKLAGNFIKAYTFSSKDNMMRFSVAQSTVETIWTLDLDAYGKVWAHDPSGIETVGDYSQTAVQLPDIPIKVEYDENSKLYKYSAHLVSRQPFRNDEDKKIASSFTSILTCSVYRLYIFEHKNPNHELMQDCISKIFYQMLDKNQRKSKSS